MMALIQDNPFRSKRAGSRSKIKSWAIGLHFQLKTLGMHLLEWNLVRIEYDNGNRLLPRIHIDDGLFNDLCYPWHDSLIIKLLGRNIGYYQLNTRLKGTWKLTGGFELMDVDNGFFMVKFDLEEDRAKVISGGPWMVLDHYLAVSQWF